MCAVLLAVANHAKQGWTEDASINMGEATMLIYQKNARNAQVSIAAQGGQTHVSLVATR